MSEQLLVPETPSPEASSYQEAEAEAYRLAIETAAYERVAALIAFAEGSNNEFQIYVSDGYTPHIDIFRRFNELRIKKQAVHPKLTNVILAKTVFPYPDDEQGRYDTLYTASRIKSRPPRPKLLR